jgi:AcrR family transcriptional regulator
VSTEKVSPRPREAILEAAMRLFSERGYTGTTMRDIAGAVGVLPGSLYAHIDGKETLLVEIIESGIEKFLAIERLVEASTEPADVRMRAAIKAHIATVAQNPERMLIVFHQWRFLGEANRARAVGMRRRYARIFTRIVNDGIETGVFDKDLDPRIAVFSILGALNWTPEWYSPGGSMSADAIGEQMANTLLCGLLVQR